MRITAFTNFMRRTGYRLVGARDWSLDASRECLRGAVLGREDYQLTFVKRCDGVDIYHRIAVSDHGIVTRMRSNFWSAGNLSVADDNAAMTRPAYAARYASEFAADNGHRLRLQLEALPDVDRRVCHQLWTAARYCS